MYLTVYSPGMWQDLLRNISQVAPVDRIALLRSRFRLCKAGLIPSADFLQVCLNGVFSVFLIHVVHSKLCIALQKDKHAVVLREVFTMIAEFSKVWRLVPARTGDERSIGDMLKAFSARLAAIVLDRFGEVAKPGEDQLCANLRLAALRNLAGVEGKEAIFMFLFKCLLDTKAMRFDLFIVANSLTGALCRPKSSPLLATLDPWIS